MCNINASGGVCGPGSRVGQLLSILTRITLSNSTTGSVSQIKCEGAIDEIVFNLLDGATNPKVSGLPLGVDYQYVSANNTVRILT